MPALQVREFPGDLYEELRSRARREHRSVSQQTIVAVQEHLHAAPGVTAFQQPVSESQNQARRERRRSYFEELARLGDVTIPPGFPSPAEIVRQTREGR
ncbi:MAG: hypothetical protein LBC23_05385 [Coriobacteriales bacterium]|jgi:hypothetical protein|nr:hypothetical protein [Coriobacteriales bacterium]